MSAVREDVHIHAASRDVYAHIAALDRHAEWLPRSFDAVEASGDTIAFRLALPLHSAGTRLAVREAEPHTRLLLSSNGDGDSALHSLEWALHVEGPSSVHVTVEAVYERAGGLLGGLLESVLHRPLRRQALRDALWRLKQRCERRGASDA